MFHAGKDANNLLFDTLETVVRLMKKASARAGLMEKPPLNRIVRSIGLYLEPSLGE